MNPATESPAETLDAPAGADVPPPAPVAADVDPVEETAFTAASAPADAEGGERTGGIPAAQLATGGLSASAVALGALYQLLGLPGLIGGAVLAGGSGVAYLRHRYHRSHPHRSTSHRHGGGGGGRKTESARTVTTSTRRPGGGAGGLFGGGRSTGGGGRSGGGAAGGLFGKGGRGGGGGGLLGGLGRSATRSGTGSGGGAGRGGRSGRASAKGAGAGSRTGAAGRAFGSRARQAAQKARAAAARIGDATGGRAKKTKTSAFGHAGRAARRAGKTMARQARRLGAAVDRRSGHRYSAAWAALRQGGGFRAARRRAAAALGGWDAQLTASVLALVAWIVDRYKARKGAADPGGQTETAPESAGTETTADPGAPESVVGDGDGDGGELPITATVTCPRCGKEHTVTVERAGAEQVAACACGYTMRLFRIPPRTSAEAASTSASTGRRGAPFTASTATNTRRNTMSANPLAAAAAEVNAAAAAHAPADMWQVARELDQLSEIPANIGMALRTYTVRLQGEYPIHPAVVEALGELYMAHAQLVDRAQEIGVLFRQVHEEDLRREEAPRTNEGAWNV